MNIQRSFIEGDSAFGKLYVVATPIGNLEDMTYRAIRMLREADWIAAEDTRHTRKLLAHFDIPGKRLVSYREQNSRASGSELLARLQAGESVALVSDAGMPAISDPGEPLVREAASLGIPVIAVPGACAALSALVVSGLSSTQFHYAGFLPRERAKQREALKTLGALESTLIIYEAPHRLQSTLKALLEQWGDRRLAVVRELTKKYEEVQRGTISEALARLEEHPAKGEYCLVIDGRQEGELQPDEQWWAQLDTAGHVAAYEAQGLTRKEAMKRAAADRNVSKRDIYRELL